SAAAGRVAAVRVTTAARVAARTLLTPPGWAASSVASPPAAGSDQTAGLASSSEPRLATKRRSPSAVNTGWDSPVGPWVRRRAGRPPAGSTYMTAVWYVVGSSFSVLTAVTGRRPSGERASPPSRGRAM